MRGGAVTKRLFAAVVLAGLAALIAWPKLSPLLPGGASDGGTGGRFSARAPAVETLRIDVAPFASKVTFNGTLIADKAIDIKSELRGKIDRIAFTDGQTVEPGDLIVSIESGELEAELSSVREQLALAKTTAERLESLFSSGSVTASERDDAVSRREVLKAEARRLAVRLEKTRLLAPFSGTLGLREVSPGDLIEADTQITTLQTVADLKVDFSVPERYQALLDSGMSLSLWIAGYDEPFSARIRAISPRVDVDTRTIRVRADVVNAEGRLLPGSYARVELIKRDDAAIVVPSVAVLKSVEAVSVFKVQDGIAVRTEVETGIRTEAKVQILQGLQAGDEIIVRGIQGVRDGQRVDVRKSADKV